MSIYRKLLLMVISILIIVGGQGVMATDLVNLDHLDYLNEDVLINNQQMVITHIYADAPDYKWTDASGEGIACVDDTARAAVVYLKHYKYYGDKKSLDMARKALNFVLYMQAEDGEFYNFINKDLTINKYGNTSFKTYSWWAARAVWALGLGYNIFHDIDPEFAAKQEKALLKAVEAARDYIGPRETVNINGYEMPRWLIRGEADITAVTVLGLLEYYQASPLDGIKKIIEKLVTGIIKTQHGSFTEFPFNRYASLYNSITSWHNWGSRQTQAVAKAGRIFERKDWITSARKAAEGWLGKLLVDGYVYEITPAFVRYEQIAYSVNVVVQAYIELYKATGEEKYARLAGIAASWYLGNNPAGIKMYDQSTGRTYDGIDYGKINKNSGAESTIEALMSFIEVDNSNLAKKYLKYNQIVEKNVAIYIEGEKGYTSKGNPQVKFGTSGGNYGKYSGDKYISLTSGDRVDYTVHIGKEQEYFVYLIYEKKKIPEGKAKIKVMIDGSPLGELDQGGAIGNNHLFQEKIDCKVRLKEGKHTISLLGISDKGQKIKIDQLILQPIKEYRILASKEGNKIKLLKDYQNRTLQIK